MENKAHAIAAGAFVLLLSAMLVALAIWLTREAGFWQSYEIETTRSISGLQSQASVRYRGLKVGKVSSIGFDPHKPGQVLVQIEVEEGTPVTRSTFATLGFLGLTGIAFIQLDDSGESTERLTPAGDSLPRIPMRQGLVDRLTEQGEKILAELEQGSRRVNQLLALENQKALVDSLKAVERASAGLPELVRATDATLKAVRDMSTSVSTSAGRVEQTAQDYTRLAQRVQQSGGTLDQLEASVGKLAAGGNALQRETLPRLNRVMEEAGLAARQTGRAASTLADNPQALIFGAGQNPPGPGEPGFAAPPSKP
jgi:phospholipid/cholesterol/gamma-HCH transport system substrate-binding protein